MRYPLIRSLLCAIAALALLAGCASEPVRPLTPLTGVSIGVAGAVQPTGTVDLLAGYIPEQRELASDEALLAFDEAMLSMIRTNADPARSIVSVPRAHVKESSQKAAGQNTALTRWVETARAAGVDLLIVPQILFWHDRQGGPMGAVTSADVFIQFYLIDAKAGTLLARSVFNEKQQSLAGDLLQAPIFFRRGGKWLTAQELANEGIMKMIKEFGL